MATVALRVTDAAKVYVNGGHETPVFSEVDLAVESGEILALLGPSGCGKSTLLRAVAGLDELSGGTIEWPGEGDADARVGVVFQQPLLLPWLTVQENVTLGLRYRAHRGVADDEAVASIIAEFGLSDLVEAYPDELSGGQAQRVSVARTVVTSPQVVLLDEPFSALDPLTRASMQDWLVGIQQSLGLTAVIVTHDVDEAVFLGDRVAMMSPAPGTIVQSWRLDRATRAERGGQAAEEMKRDILATYRGVQQRTQPASARAGAATQVAAGV
jgi:sulfate transport system ATP-binding protein/sulfonate transport system ATP-binding protein